MQLVDLEAKMTRVKRAKKSSYALAIVGFLAALILMHLITEQAVAKAKGSPVISTFDLSAHDRAYRIFVAVPHNALKTEPLPVIYMLDGNATFPMAVKVLEENPKMRAIIVGIGYPTDDPEEIIAARYYDLTPPTAADRIPARKNGAPPPRTGGQADFLHFIQTQVRPEIEQRYAIDKEAQTLFGHSLGGMFTLHAMFSDRGSFQNYSAADPSIWWNGGSILVEKDQFVEAAKTKNIPVKLLPVKLLIETSGKRVERTGADTKSAEQLRKLRGGPSGKDVYEEIAPLPEISAAFHQFADESHGSMLPLAVKDTLEHFAVKLEHLGGGNNATK